MPSHPVAELSATVAYHPADALGEGPVWDDRTAELVHVDITGGAVRRWRPADGRRRDRTVDGEVAAIILREDGGEVLAIGHRLVARSPAGTETELARVEEDRPDNRFNDCRSDPAGRIWAGTMSKSQEAGRAALYRLDGPGRLTPAVGAVTMSNGLDWPPDGSAMVYVDSPTQRVDRFDVEAATGALSGRRPLIDVDPAGGTPDGLVLDREGGLWLCLFGGGVVQHHDAEGRLDARIRLPTSNPTCPTFGGEDLDVLYVTTARHELTAEQLAAQPLAGAVFAARPAVGGHAARRSRG